MTSKTLNIIMLVCLILFSVIFGVAATLKAEEFRRLDEAYEDEVQDNLEKENESILDDLNTQNKNEQINNGSNSTTNSDDNNTNGGVVNFSDFITMFNYAENKLNNSTNIHSVANGSCVLNGSTNKGGYTLNNDKVDVSFVRAQNSGQKYFTYNVNGRVMNNFYSLNLKTSIYSEGAIYYIYSNQDGAKWKSISKSAVDEKFNWNTNQTFQEINESSVKSSTFYYDKYSRTYIATAELNPQISGVRFKNTLMGVLNATDPANIISSKISVTVDSYGNFKSIRYEDTFSVLIYDSDKKMTINVTIKSDIVETFKVAGNGTVIINRPNI